MNVYIVRHAEAIERGSTNIPDGDRYLTPKGRSLFRKTAKNMIRAGAAPDVIVTSPLVRSVQTAEILCEKMGFKGECLVAGALAPGFALPGLRKILSELPPLREIALVGHDPDLSDLLVSLLPLGDGFRLKKGAVVALCVDPSRLKSSAEFLWMALGKRRVDSLDDLNV